jgi:hypothetical protein
MAALVGGVLVLAIALGFALLVPAFSYKKIHKPAVGTPVVEVLDSVRIPWNYRISELSGLAWDQDEQLLYAVSDLGHIIHFKVRVTDNRIQSVEPVFFGPLTLTVGQEKFFDTEDLVAINSSNGKKGDSEIAVVFEDGPAAARFTATGQFIETIQVPAPLVDRAHYRQ